MRRPFIIRIGGISQAGKGTLCEKLAAHLVQDGMTVDRLEMDEFVHEEDSIEKVEDRVNWEVPESVNWEQLIAKVSQSQADVLIIEGIFVFCDQLKEVDTDLSIKINVDYETFIQRRSLDKRWGEEPRWYLDHVWKSNNELLQNANPDVVLDQSSAEDVANLVVAIKERIG